MHHYEGRNNSNNLIPACKNCHAKVSAEQNKLSPKARSANASLKQKKAYYYVSIGALLEVLGKNLKEHGFEEANIE